MRGSRSSFVLWIVAPGLWAAAAGCGDDDSSATDVGRDDAAVEDAGDVAPEDVGDAPVEADPPVSVTFVVMEPLEDGTDAVLAGATAAFDAPGGGRTELTTGADGTVTFEDVVWSAGTAALTVHLEGYVVVSRVGLDADVLAAAEQVGGAVVVRLPPLPETPEMIEITGTATGLVDPVHGMVVNVANVPDGSQWVGEGTGAFSIDVPRNVPFVLQGWEYSQAELPSGRGYEQTLHRVMQQEFPATSEDIAGMEMDFAANEVTMATADVSVLMPTRGESRLRSGRAVALVCENDSYACIGWASRAEITADRSRIEASLLFAEPDWVEDEDVFGLYGAYADGNESVSRAIVYGWPTDGALDDVRLLDLPEVIVPATPTTRHPLATPFVWELHETGVEVGVLLLRDETTVWMIIPPPDGTTATAPRLPSTTSTAGLLGTGVVQGVLRILRRDTVASGPLVRVAQPRSFIVVP